jgi:hypothetical protein
VALLVVHACLVAAFTRVNTADVHNTIELTLWVPTAAFHTNAAWIHAGGCVTMPVTLVVAHPEERAIIDAPCDFIAIFSCVDMDRDLLGTRFCLGPRVCLIFHLIPNGTTVRV